MSSKQAATRMEALLGPLLQTGSGEKIPTADAFAGIKYVGIYFSGHCETQPAQRRLRPDATFPAAPPAYARDCR